MHKLVAQSRRLERQLCLLPWFGIAQNPIHVLVPFELLVLLSCVAGVVDYCVFDCFHAVSSLLLLIPCKSSYPFCHTINWVACGPNFLPLFVATYPLTSTF